MAQKKVGKSSLWKWLFLILLAFNLAFLGIIASRLLQIREPEIHQIKEKKQKAIKLGTFVTDKEQLNETIRLYLKPYQSESTTYKVYTASSRMLFEGKYKVLGYEVPLYIYFEPYRLESGAVQLKLSSLSAGTLPLPEKDILLYIKRNYDLPKIVEIVPKESSIVIHLQDLENEAGIYLEANKIDLVGDQISFDIYQKTSNITSASTGKK